MYCTKCGQENANSARLCQRCGAAMSRVEMRTIKGRDVVGFILGGIMLLPLIWQIWWLGKALWTDHQSLGPYRGFLMVSVSLTAMVTLVAACLFIPARYYEKASARRVGFIGTSVSAAFCVAAVGAFVACIVLQVLAFTDKSTETDYLFLPLLLLVPAATAAALFWSSTYVLVKKTGLTWSRVALGAFAVLALSAIFIAIGWYAGT